MNKTGFLISFLIVFLVVIKQNQIHKQSSGAQKVAKIPNVKKILSKDLKNFS